MEPELDPGRISEQHHPNAEHARGTGGFVAGTARYFAADKTREAAGQGITAEKAQKLYATMASAQKALAENGTRRKELRAERDQADANLRLLMRGVIAEIRVRLSKDSPLWGSFGLSAPKARKRKAKADAEKPQTTATSSVVNMAA